ncbi:MAG: 4-hydroxy-3-methylbut-2-enyl diphosphate reductase [Deltaproteobacteria bacterium]|nr:4-hydroxy-3-methylbut-2-enyl diphosphate reductase [Deltaproteobacteria bacterium]MBZ0219047.1 4-hydroxy-3-methylbut-2-enyl diphosphate reductase [Deltaproteobacteria bacterium]
MEILVAKSSGFCFGVKRAINMAGKCASEEEKDGGIHTLGPIIHNPQVVKMLEESRVYAKNDLSEIDSGTVIIRSHGVTFEEYKEAREKGLNIVDATCPFVKTAQELVSRLTGEGYQVIVAGEKDHPEVKGLMSYGDNKVRVVSGIAELVDMPRVSKLGIVAQTTLRMEKLEEIVSFCLHKASELKVFNTICNATSTRQTESAALAKEVDIMVIVGGKNSANTRRLAEVCRAIQPETYHIETASELSPEWFAGKRRAGVTSGASTPEWLIEEVVKRLREISSK